MTSDTAAASSSRGRRAPRLLVAAAGLVALGAVAPVAYLTLRALSADGDARALAPLATTLELTWDTATLAFGVVVATLVVGVPFAWLVVRTDLPGRRLWGIAASLPLVIPSFVAALALLGAFAPRGLVQEALEPIGVERLPEVTGYWGALVALTLSTYPYVYLLTASGLRSVDPTAEEAARSLGAGRARVFARVTLPALRPSIAAASLLVALYVLSDFGVVSLMGYSTLTTGIYVRYESLLALESAAILALVLVALALAIVLLASRFRLRGAIYRSTPGAGRTARIVHLGRWRWLALAFCSSVIGLFLVLPLGVLAWWSARADPDLRARWRRLVGRARLGLAGGGSQRSSPPSSCCPRHSSPGAIPPPSRAGSNASRSCRARFRGSPWRWRSCSWAPASARPSIRASGSFSSRTSFASCRTDSPRRAPRSTRSAHVSRRRRDRSAEARLGATLAVVLPLARSGILAGAALVFLSTIKELPATLLLKPIGFETLATEIWAGTAIGAYSEVAPSALLLIAIAAPLVYLLSWRNAWELARGQS